MVHSPQLISLIIPCHNEEELLTDFYEATQALICRLTVDIELIFIDDGSDDNTWLEIKKIKRKYQPTQAIKFSRQFGKEAALFAGLTHAKGDAAIPLDVDLQDPIEIVSMFIQEWQLGYDMVIGQRKKRPFDSFFKRTTAKWFYIVHNALSEIRIPENGSDFRLISRKVINEIIKLPENQLFMKGLFSWVGFKTKIIPYTSQSRKKGKSKFTWWRLWNFALDGITAFSTLPLRIWGYLGGFICILSVVYTAYIILKTLYFGIDVPGYASLFTAIMFFGSVQLISVGILGEYIGRLHTECKQRPRYIIDQHYAGDTLATASREVNHAQSMS
ncbi:MAG: glycosyltransferase family 2 protein [bacterium]